MPHYRIKVGDLRDVLKKLPDNYFDSVVCDPPYELSEDAKASASRVALELMFPQNPKIKAVFAGKDRLSDLIRKILFLGGTSTNIPTPPAAVPISSVTFDQNLSDGQVDVVDAIESSVTVTHTETGHERESQTPKHLGSFCLEFTDAAAILNVLNSAGTGFDSGSLGVGFGVFSTSLPSLLHSCGCVIHGDSDIGPLNNAFANFIRTCPAATESLVTRVGFAHRPIETLDAYRALVFFAILKIGGAKLIAASTATSGLPSKFQTRRVCIVHPTTHRALSVDILFQEQNISSTGFMGNTWDGSKVAFDVATWKAAMRVLKPGGYLLAFGGSRTSHRVAVAIEDAGFELRDTVMWIHSQGFPKSLDVSKAIDKAAGVERDKKIGGYQHPDGKVRNWGEHNSDAVGYMKGYKGSDRAITLPSTESAKTWDGWGTALKPAFEPIIVARKPLGEKTVAKNVLKYGTGAINVGACRIGTEAVPINKLEQWSGFGQKEKPAYTATVSQGRFPANVIHDGSDEVETEFGKSGESKTVARKIQAAPSDSFGTFKTNKRTTTVPVTDSGTAARFFYCAKPSKRERNEATQNGHPTVKPVALMRYLVRLVTPPKGIVLDPFVGSGSTGVAALREGFHFYGVDLTPEYGTIAEARLRHAQEKLKAPK